MRYEIQEVTSINKQKFLTELGKLLTFMYDDDRERALALYEQMFDDAGDEWALIQALVSPTKQAVVVARAYSSNHGKLSLRSGVKAAPEDIDENGVPDYIQAIEAVREQAWETQSVSAAEEIPEEEPQPAPAGEENAAETEEAREETSDEEKAAPEEEETTAPAEETEDTAPDEEEEDKPLDEESEGKPLDEESEDKPLDEESEDTATGETSPEEGTEESISPEAESAEESAPEVKAAAVEGIEFFTPPEEGKESADAASDETLPDGNGFNVNNAKLNKPKRKPRVFLLILYILLAIPLTICAIAVLLVPAVLFLALSIASIVCGVVLAGSIIQSFATLTVLADTLVLIGVVLVLFALGLLFLWTSIWFIGGAIVGVVHGVAALGDKWCYKEVSEG